MEYIWIYNLYNQQSWYVAVWKWVYPQNGYVHTINGDWNSIFRHTHIGKDELIPKYEG